MRSSAAPPNGSSAPSPPSEPKYEVKLSATGAETGTGAAAVAVAVAGGTTAEDVVVVDTEPGRAEGTVAETEGGATVSVGAGAAEKAKSSCPSVSK